MRTLAVLLLATVLVRPAYAAASPGAFPLDFHVSGGDATSTLTEFSRQAHLQLLFDYNIVKGHTTRPLNGRFTLAEALKALLANTDLEFDFVNERTFAVTQKQIVRTGAKIGQSETKVPNPPPQPKLHITLPNSTSSAIDVIRVTGTYLHDEPPIGEEVISASGEDIEATGAATSADFLRTLPQTFGGGPNQDTFIGEEALSNSGLGVGVNLRGLGARATLVLINGRRVAPSGNEGEFVDIENIPLTAIERVDILPDSASATYGADAVGGVVNFVLREKFDGAQTIVRGGAGTRGDLQEYLASQTLGNSWDGGNGLISFEFYHRGALPAADRSYAVSDLRPFGGVNFDTNFANPGTIFDRYTGQTWAIPAGQNGTHLTAADLIAGTQNLQSRYLDAQIIPTQERWTLYGSGRQALSDRVTLFSDVLLGHRNTTATYAPIGDIIEAPSSNPFYVMPTGYTNPTGGKPPVIVGYNFGKDLGPLMPDTGIDTLNATLGLDMDVGASWSVKTYVSYVREKENEMVRGSLNTPALQLALADSNPLTAFNPFGDGANTNPATLDKIRANNRFWLDSQLKTFNITADGSIGKLAGIPLKLAIGADWREQPFATTYVAPETVPGISAAINDVDLTRKVLSAFGQLVAPVFSEADAIPALRTLELSAAGRYEDYRGYVSATTPKYGVAWSPLRGVTFRGTLSNSVRPPTLVDLDMNRNVSFTTFAPDPKSSVLLWSGGNAAVHPEHAQSWTAGMDLTPPTVPGLSLAFTYFRTAFTDRILSTANFSPTMLNDPVYASIVTHNPSAAEVAYVCNHSIYQEGSAAQCMNMPAGAIVDLRVRNLARLLTDGIDFSGNYERPTALGKLTFGLSGTWLRDFAEAQTPDAALTSLLSTQNEPINLRLRATTGWHLHGFDALLSENFTNSYRDTTSSPARRVAAWITTDVQLRYDFPLDSNSWLQGVRVELNAHNVFNVNPPFLNNQVTYIGYDQENADPYGRILSLQLRKMW